MMQKVRKARIYFKTKNGVKSYVMIFPQNYNRWEKLKYLVDNFMNYNHVYHIKFHYDQPSVPNAESIVMTTIIKRHIKNYRRLKQLDKMFN